MSRRSAPGGRVWVGAASALLLLVILVSGCQSLGPRPLPVTSRGTHSDRAFDFTKDTFAFANELRWEYQYDDQGHWTTAKRDPPPVYSLHCLVLARSARQFFIKARFDPGRPIAAPETYRRLIRAVVSTNPRCRAPAVAPLTIPGYPDLRAFSRAQGDLVKAECGGAWQSYLQRGNWRMIFPFSRRQQQRTAERLAAELRPDWPLIVHLVRFPELTINHTVVIFGARKTDDGIRFSIYDPNQPAAPVQLKFDRATRTFLLPPTPYFPGGRVDVYELYWKWDY